jgi:hypothetical protein
MAGIINIVLKGNAELGLSGGVTLSAGTSDRYNGSGNLGYQRGRVTLFGSYGYFGDGRTSTGFNNRSNYLGTSLLDYLNQASDSDTDMRSHTVNTNTELKLDKTSSLASTLMLSARDFGQNTRSDFRRLNATQDPLGRSSNRQRMDVGRPDLRRHAVVQERDPPAPERAVGGGAPQPLVVRAVERLLHPAAGRGHGAPLGTQPGRTRNLTDAVNSEAYVQADLTRMLAGARVETGLKTQLRQVDNDLVQERFSYDREGWVDAGGTNDFALDETVHAGYGVVTRNLKKLSCRAGCAWSAPTAAPTVTTTWMPSRTSSPARLRRTTSRTRAR